MNCAGRCAAGATARPPESIQNKTIPDIIKAVRAKGITGATSNPIIIADLIKTGRFDAELSKLMNEG